MTIEAQSANFGTRTVIAGSSIYKTGSSTDLTNSTNTLVSEKVSTSTTKIKGTEIVAALNIGTAFTTNGTAAVAGTASLTLADSKYTLADTTGTTPALTIETPTATRTFFQDKSGTAGTATFTFDKAAVVGQSIAITMVKPDGTSVTKAFKSAAVGTANGTEALGFVQFATYDSGSVGDAAQAEDSAANFKTALESAAGFGDTANGDLVNAYANVTSVAEGAGAAQGKVIIEATRPGTVTNKAITPTATSASAVNAIDTTGFDFSNADASFTILIPTSAGGLGGTAVTIDLDWDIDTAVVSDANTISIGCYGLTDAQTAAAIINALNGVTSSIIAYATSGNGEASDDLGIVAAQGSSDTQITITIDDTGEDTNLSGAIATAGGVDMVDETDFTGGTKWNDACSVAVPAAMTGGVDDTASLAQAEVNLSHGGRWAGYKLAEAVSHATNGLGNYGLTATNVNNVVTFTALAGAAGNSTTFTTNASWPQLSTVLPPKYTTGGIDATPPNLAYRVSLDGITYTDWTEIVSDVGANVTGIKLGTFTVPNSVPYIQFGFNTNSGNLTSKTGSVSFEFVGGI